MATLWQSLRYTLRVLAKNPGFTAVAILSLALGIGANTAIFTLINALLLRSLPVRHPERLVYLSAVRQGSKITFSYPMFRELERGQRVFSGMIGWGGNWMPNVEVNGVLSQDRVLSVTGNCYSKLGASPLLGRYSIPKMKISPAAPTRKSPLSGMNSGSAASAALATLSESRFASRGILSRLSASLASGSPA